MTNVFAGGAVIAGAEGIELTSIRSALQCADAVDIVEEFAEQASPGLSLGELLVCDEIEATHVALDMECKGVVTGTIVGLEYIHIRHNAGLVVGVVWIRS